ncbi:MAG: SusC/RagA family TonB-linked outer membrane protein [Bacteroidia bacterium]|nr:SusC/RagA family TonB-linked outer membrane protein [Bacteroidia bacterium]
MKYIRFLLIIGLSMISANLFAQKTVSGTLTSSDGQALIGVTVLEEGTTNGRFTDDEGKYTITVAGPNSVLVFSYTGMKRVMMQVGDQSTINIQMEASDLLLDEVVISALGFKESKDQLGSTYSVIDPVSVQRSGEANLLNALGAKASNVRINRTNGDPGAGSTIRIRGANTISGDGSPLVVVDGVPLNNSTTYGGGNNITGGRTGGTSQQSRLNDINPNDIESVQILKGASAAALWGSRAANGVIVITTKDGAAGKPKINYKASYSIDRINERVPMQTVWGQGRSGSFIAGNAESWGDYIPDRAGGQDEFDMSGERFVAESGNIYYPIESKNSRETFVEENWNEAFGNGGFFQQDFSISGGGQKATYFFSLGRLDQEGIIKGSSYDRNNIRFNNKLFLTDWLTMTTKSSYTLTNSNRIQQNSNTAGLMLGLLRTSPDFDGRDYLGTYIDDDGQEFNRRHRSYRRPLGDRDNPTYNSAGWTVEQQVSSSNVNRFTVTPIFDITPTNWLQIKLRGNADISDDKRVYFFPIGSGGNRSVGIFAEDIIGRRELNFDAIAKGNFKLTDAIDLTATAGWSINDRTYRRNSGQITGFLVNASKETTSLNTAAENSEFENFKTFRRSNRGYGILGFDFDDQLFVNLSGGYEASSTISDQFFYPAVDAAWDFTKSGLKSDVLSFGKLRASWGKVGVQPRSHAFQTLAEGGFSYSTYSDPLNISLFGGGFRIDNNQGNPDLQPEIKTEWEIGTDLRFFNDRLAFSFTYYSNEIDGILLDVDLSPSSGFSTKYGNFGSMENEGIELDLSYAAIQKQDLSLDVFVNWAKNENLVTDLEGTETIDLTGASVSSRAIVGYPLGVLYGTGSRTLENGDYDLDENGFPQLTNSPIVLGDPNPDWRGGVGFNFRWKNLGLNMLLEHSQGGEFSPRTLWVLRRFGTTMETANRVTLSQDLVNFAGNTIPAGSTVRGNIENFGGGDVLLDESWYRTGIGGGFGDNQAYNFSVFDATFTKIRELTLSYTLDESMGLPLNGIIVSATARNVFNRNKIDGIDPETSQTGVGNGFGLEYFTNPQTESYVFTVSVNF